MSVALRTESPIEALMAEALVDAAYLEGHDIGREIEVASQVRVGAYRADFLLTETTPEGFASFPREVVVELVVECDGHDFHERTKEQARHDRRRDRAMLGLGFPVIRFTGSEIHDSPIGCALDAMEMLVALSRYQAHGLGLDPGTSDLVGVA